jgi:AcrR family transcriptional regulator
VSPVSGKNSSTRRLRVDALRNRQQVLAAARDVFVEDGVDAPLDAVARRAGVGIATLYRRFPDRDSLIRAVVLDVLRQVGEDAKRALAEEPSGFQALARYMHRALDARIAAVFPALLGRFPQDDPECLAAHDAATDPVELIIDDAQNEGSIRPDVTFGDVGLMLIRLSRPLPGTFPRELDNRLAHRHLDLLLDGMRANAWSETAELSGPAMTLEALQELGRQALRSGERHR